MSMQPVSIDAPLAPALSASALERHMRSTPFRLLVERIEGVVVAAISTGLRPFRWQSTLIRVIKVSA